MGTRLHVGTRDEDEYGSCTALQAGDRIFVSGLRGAVGDGADAQFQAIIERVEKALASFESSLRDVVRTRVFYTHPQDRPRLVTAHGKSFGSIGPAASLTEVHALPDGASVMVEVEAVRGSADTRRTLPLDNPEANAMGCAALVQVGKELWFAGITAQSPGGSAIAPGDAAAQTREVVSKVLSLLDAVGGKPADVVSTRHYVPVAYVTANTGPERLPLMHPGHPTSAGITVQGVGSRDLGVLIEAEAVLGAAEERRNVNTGRTYEEEHHYSRAVRVDDVVYVSGTTSVQIGEVVGSPFDAYGQTRQALDWVRWGIERLGLPFSDLVRTRSYVVGEENLEPVARALRETLGETRPTATMVGVPALGRSEILVEVEATAVKGAGGT